MVVQTKDIMPTSVTAKIWGFLQAGKSGSIQLDVKEGKILACKLTESIRFDRHGIDKT